MFGWTKYNIIWREKKIKVPKLDVRSIVPIQSSAVIGSSYVNCLHVVLTSAYLVYKHEQWTRRSTGHNYAANYTVRPSSNTLNTVLAWWSNALRRSWHCKYLCVLCIIGIEYLITVRNKCIAYKHCNSYLYSKTHQYHLIYLIAAMGTKQVICTTSRVLIVHQSLCCLSFSCTYNTRSPEN